MEIANNQELDPNDIRQTISIDDISLPPQKKARIEDHSSEKITIL